ncbi:hypothetical protein CCHL11_03861 [Colletotrichum chlorophyti]|uniref:Uncharacterized protein n=1 Tax=Colletotrichum chlorophyti TaxID=708187 RepID=A0A1Q8RR12_9PEZI|nr:hypothetical protein CCHL11_03861 [Colletotrichum chlorophyti]
MELKYRRALGSALDLTRATDAATSRVAADAQKEAAEAQKRQGEDLYLLRTAPEDQALEIFWRMRRGGSAQALRTTSRRQGSVSGQPQHNAQNPPFVSPTASPVPVSGLSAAHALPDSRPLPADTASPGLKPVESPLPPSQPPTTSSEETDCKKRFECLDIVYWTTVSIDRRIAAGIISSYVRTDHPIWGYLNVDLFIRDLMEKGFDYCSPFLLNAMLLRTFTERLWRAERSCDSILNLAAILMFWVNYGTTSCDVTLVTKLLEDGRRMAVRVRLFGVTDSAEVARRFDALRDEWKRADITL